MRRVYVWCHSRRWIFVVDLETSRTVSHWQNFRSLLEISFWDTSKNLSPCSFLSYSDFERCTNREQGHRQLNERRRTAGTCQSICCRSTSSESTWSWISEHNRYRIRPRFSFEFGESKEPHTQNVKNQQWERNTDGEQWCSQRKSKLRDPVEPSDWKNADHEQR